MIPLFLLALAALVSSGDGMDEEEEMRHRMELYAKEKFGHHYHYWNESQLQNDRRALDRNLLRVRRDGGLITGTTAVVTGIIGLTAKAVADMTGFHGTHSTGGCVWSGTSPFCDQECPPEYDYIRKHNGRCSEWWFGGACVPDDSFGKPCTTLLFGYFYKRFCCKSDPGDCTWSGRWMGANTAYNMYCRYDNIGTCGALDCSINHFNFKAQSSGSISGVRCDEVELFGLHGKATCGYVAWYDANDTLVNSWYKTR